METSAVPITAEAKSSREPKDRRVGGESHQKTRLIRAVNFTIGVVVHRALVARVVIRRFCRA